MRSGIWALALLLCTVNLSAAQASTPKEAFSSLNRCVQQQKPMQCRDRLTADSIELYDRFARYGLLECLPRDVAFVSQKNMGDTAFVRVQSQETNSFARLAFVEEEEEWKLSIPASLEAGLGENWRDRVEMTEQLYLALKSRMGGKLGCNAVRNLTKSASAQ